MSDIHHEGMYKNLLAQAKSVYRKSNERSYGTRARYFEAEKRFCGFLADNAHLQKLSNVTAKHIVAYVDYMLQSGKAPGTIQSDLSGIRYFHDRTGSKNKLPANAVLNIPKRHVGAFDRSWLVSEIKDAYDLAIKMGRYDVAAAILYAWKFGLRISEICTLRVEYLKSALRYGQLEIKGKGGQIRHIPLDDEQKAIMKRHLDDARKRNLADGDYLISRSEKNGVKNEIRSLENWLNHNRKKFINPSRIKMVKQGNKDKLECISWHGLRHTFATNYRAKMEALHPGMGDKLTSEVLGHHREEITMIYLPTKPAGRSKGK